MICVYWKLFPTLGDNELAIWFLSISLFSLSTVCLVFKFFLIVFIWSLVCFDWGKIPQDFFLRSQILRERLRTKNDYTLLYTKWNAKVFGLHTKWSMYVSVNIEFWQNRQQHLNHTQSEATSASTWSTIELYKMQFFFLYYGLLWPYADTILGFFWEKLNWLSPLGKRKCFLEKWLF